jgi:16S rRNA (adenine1518-N6/adenine1519-N6)-dimethyltransferase
LQLRKYRSRRQRLGQHFLTRRSAVERVVAGIAPLPGERFLEVGPGRGALTLPLLAAGAEVLAVELDPSLAERLSLKAVPQGRLTVVQGDILKVDLKNLLAGRFPPGPTVRVVGNLPYSVASPTILRLLRRDDRFADWTLMVQREVAERILAPAGSRIFGVLTLLCAARATCRRILDLAPACFSPPPAVHSTLLHFAPRPSPFSSPTEEAVFERVVKAAFSARRKMLRNTLAAGLKVEVALAEATARACGINPEDRPERVPLQGYVELTRHLKSRIL